MIWILWFLQHPGQTTSSSSGTSMPEWAQTTKLERSDWNGRSRKMQQHGLLLLRKCAEHKLLITNTVFRLPTRRKTSWMHPSSKHWHLTDYVIAHRKDRQDVRLTKTMCGADCWTDHRFVVNKLNLRIQSVRRLQDKKVPMRLDVSKLKQASKRQTFINDIAAVYMHSLDRSSEDVTENWTVFRDTVHSSKWIP